MYSQPCWSYPSQCAPVGVPFELDRSQSRGSIPRANSDGNTAMSTKIRPSTAPVQNITLRRNCAQASLHRLFWRALVTSTDGLARPVVVPACTSSWSRSDCCCSVITDPRVEDGVEHVDDQVEEDEEEHEEGHDADDDGALLASDRLEDGPSQAGRLKTVSVTIAPPSK